MRVGVVGCGQHATDVLLPELIALDVGIAAICARRQSSAQAAADRFRVPAAYSVVSEMISRERLDAVVACVPPDAYGDVIRPCIAAGLPVFAEKPGASDAREATELAHRAADAGVPVMVGYMKRFAPAYRQARSCLLEPGFGTPSLASFTFVMGDMEVGLAEYLVDNPVHHLDLARFLIGELHDVQVTPGRSVGGQHALVVSARAETGCVVSFQLGSTGSWYQHNESVEIFGAGSSLQVSNLDTCVLRPPEGPEQRWRPNYTIPIEPNLTRTTMGFRPELVHFVDVVHGKAACESDLASAAATLALCAQVRDGVERR